MPDVLLRVLALSLSGTLVGVVVWAVSRLLGRRLSQTWRYYVWLIVLLRLVVPIAPEGNMIALLSRPPAQRTAPVIAAPIYDVHWPALHDAPPAPETGAIPAEGADASPAPQRRSLAAILVDLWQYAWVVWLGVALMLLVRAVTSYHAFTRFIRAGWQPVADPATLDVLDAVCQRYGIRKPLPLYHNPLAASPMLVGALRPVIVLPDVSMERGKLEHILAHELVHRKRLDILYKWFVQLVACLHWFNPMIYLAKRDIGVACELSCDERVLARMQREEHRHYGDTLLAALQHSGHYGDTVASVTMSEEGKMMKKRLQSIAHPHRRSRLSVLGSVLLTGLLLLGAAFAGAYAEPAAEAPLAAEPTTSAEVTPDVKVTPVPTAKLTPGQRLDQFLDDMDELTTSLGEHAVEWGETVAEKAGEWAASWDWNWPDSWPWESDGSERMFSRSTNGDHIMINGGYYGHGYIVHLCYDSAMAPSEATLTTQGGTAIVIPASLQIDTGDAALADALLAAADTFIDQNPDVAADASLQLVRVDGPYEETPDALLDRFYRGSDLGRFVAVYNSGLISEDQRIALLRDAAASDNVAAFSILLDAGIPVALADELIEAAYDADDIAIFYILLDHASAEARDRIQTRALTEGKTSFLSGVIDSPDEASVNALIDQMADDLDPAAIALVSDFLTEAQAQRLATLAYEQNDIASFSIAMDYLSAEDIKGFHDRAQADNNAPFFSVTGE